MRPILLIAAREWRALVFSPTGLVVTLLYLGMAGYLFALQVTLSQEASLRATFSALGLLTVFLVPLITMRLLSEKLRTGTFEVLIAHPVTDTQVVLGKHLAGWLIFLGLTIPGFGYLLILQALGSPDWGMALSGYLGQQFLGSLLLALGLFVSATTHSQVLAAMGAMIGGVLLWLACVSRLTRGLWSFHQTFLVLLAVGAIALPCWWNRFRLRAELACRRAGPATAAWSPRRDRRFRLG